MVTRDANRIWQVAPKLNDRQYRPPTITHQAQLRKLSVIVHVTRTLRPFDADTGEAAWEQRVIRRLTTTHDNYLRPMQNNLHEQCKARFSLRPGKTLETYSQYPRSLKAMKPMSKEAIQRTLKTHRNTQRNFGKRGVSYCARPWAYQVRSWTASQC